VDETRKSSLRFTKQCEGWGVTISDAVTLSAAGRSRAVF
jgi:hypothetical protein